MSDPLIARYAAFMRQCGLARTTVYTRTRTLERLGSWLLPVPLGEATAEQLAAWRAGLASGDQTVRGYVCDARRFYGWMIEAGLRQDNPAARLPVPRKIRRLPRPIMTADLFRAVALAPQPVRVILVLAAWCGLRAVEIAGLRRECVLETLGQPALLVAAESTKGRRERIVPLAPFPAGELAAYGLPADGPVIPRADGRTGSNRPHRISQIANAWLHSLGIAATLHQLRHWFGTEAWRSRKDLRVVQELLGHASPATTAGYAAWDMAEAVDVVEALPVPPGLRVVAG